MPLQINRKPAIKTLSNAAGNSNRVLIAGSTTGSVQGHTGLTFDGSTLSVTGVTSATSISLGGVAVTSSAAELNLVDGSSAGSVVNSKAVIYSGAGNVAATTASTTNELTVGTDLTVTGGDITLGAAADANHTSVAAVTESGTNTAGKNITIGGGLGTGNATSGDVLITVGIPTSSGTNAHTATTVIQATEAGTNTFWGGTASLGNDQGVGDIVTFGTEDAGNSPLAAGRLVYLHTDGTWQYTDADAVATGGTQLLGIALGGAVSDGILIRGFFKTNSYVEGTWNEGIPCYISEAPSEIDFTAPSGSSDVVRVLGYAAASSGVIFFQPSSTHIVIA